MASLAEVREELNQKRQEMHNIFEEAGSDLDMNKVTTIFGDSATKAAEIKRRKDEMDALGQEHDRLALLESIGKQNEAEFKILNQPQGGMAFPSGNGGGGSPPSSHSFKAHHLRQMIEDNKGYKQFRAGSLRSISMEFPAADFKTLVQVSTMTPQNTRRDGVVNLALEDRTVADLCLNGNVTAPAVEYYEETTFTNSAATVAEAATKPESALAYTLRTDTVRKIAHWVPATSEALADVPFLESQIRGRLAFGVQRIEEQQILTGDGNAPNILGLMNRSGVQTQAKGADPTPDAIYKAMQLIRGAGGSGFAEPTAVVVHPMDWTDIKLLRTADGIYLWGNPSDEGPDRIWGLPVRQTTAMTQNTALVGAFRPYAEVLRREGITITLSTEHSTYFIENKVAILAESRLALACYRPAAFAKVTGI